MTSANVHPRRPMIEALEDRTFLSSTVKLLVSFYGLGGAGTFASNWQDKIVTAAAAATGSTAGRYNESQGDQALKATLTSIDTNHNLRIEKQEVAVLNLRVFGLSFGAIQAVNFARSLAKVGTVVQGYTLGVAVPVRALVTLDPVQSATKRTAGVSSNVVCYNNYYQQRGGDARIDLFSQQTGARVGAMTLADPSSIKGQTIPSAARTTYQTRFDVGPISGKIVMNVVQPGVIGKIRGMNINHMTIPFYAYPWAVRDLTRL